ncbi:amidase [Psychromarinibacter sp. C21-152]|uniref:Amidase n=1 Tax=Psychromarinibacter sediminicola TaxID=3033385 RepID=A0AAE3NZ57_9RHOB|nr:amidase [Psychromarinibacter sediminicola]MDF0603555.1 amidase [Psychromarinibacter sediminicola]
MGDIDTLYRGSDAVGLAGHVASGDVRAAELVEAAVRAIEEINPALNAVIHKLYDIGRAGAARVAPGSSPLAGAPFLLKELASQWEGAPLTNASRYLKDLVAPADSEISRRLRAGGLCLMGKSNAPENGWSISTEPVLYGATVNPWDASVTAGGSSGGSAAAVATGMIPVAEASDGAGSIRVPASCCGVVGMKPSRGRVTLFPFADYWAGGAYFLCNSRTVRDTAAWLDVVQGALPGDPYWIAPPQQPYMTAVSRAPERLRVGFTVTPPDGRAIDAEIAAAVRQVATTLEDMGHDVSEHDMALDADAAWQTYTDMTCVETAGMFDALAEFVGRPATAEDVEPVTWAIIQRGHATRGTEHAGRVEQVRQIGREVARELDPFDIFVTPALTQPPRPVGYYDMSLTDLDAYNALWTDAVFQFPFNMSGQPAISLPLGTAKGLPAGVQLVARRGDEAGLLAVSAALEQAMPWADRRPQVA